MNNLRAKNDNIGITQMHFIFEDGGLCTEERAACVKNYPKKGECEICHKIGKTHIHHIIPVKVRPDFAWDTNNMIEICSKCHRNEEPKLNIYYDYNKISKILLPLEDMHKIAREKKRNRRYR